MLACAHSLLLRGGYTNINISPNTLHTSNQPLLQLILDNHRLPERQLLLLRQDSRVLWTREEVNQVHGSLFVDVPGLEDVGRGEVLLLSRVLDALGRGDVEVASTLCIEKTAEYGGGIEVGPVFVLVV